MDEQPGQPGGELRVALIALHFTEYTWQLAQALARHSKVLLVLDSRAATQELGALPPSKAERLEVLCIEDFRSLRGLLRAAHQLRQQIRNFRPNVLHFQEVATPLGLLLAIQLRSFPMVLTVHDPLPHSGDDRWTVGQIRQRSTLALFRWLGDAAITHGKQLVRDLESDQPRLRGHVFAAPHGPLGLPQSEHTVELGNLLFFGRIQPYKGLGLFVEAVLRLHGAGVPVRGVIAGRGPDLEPYRSRIAGHPAFDLHERYIAAEEVPGFFGRAQAVVLPYTDGTQSGVAAMALGFGRPVVSTRVGSVQEMVIEGRNGLLVAPGDIDGLVAALSRVIQEPGLSAKMAEQSVDLGRGELSWGRHAEIACQAYGHAMRLRGCSPKA